MQLTTKLFITLLLVVCTSATYAQEYQNTDSILHVKDSVNDAKIQFFIRQAEQLQRENDSLKKQRDAKAIRNAQQTSKKESPKIDTNVFEYKGNLYKRKAGYLTLGAGSAFNLKPISYKNPIIGLGLTFRVKKSYLRCNYSNIRTDATQLFRNQYFNVSLGNSKQRLKSVFSYYFGLSYSFLWQPTKDKATGLVLPEQYSQIGSYGIYSEFSYYYKPLYDIGIGPTIFVNLDFINPIAGIRLELYFANSFKRKI
ncbi:MAG: hypothetical protein H7331_04745 [Bacteroidia bacterium]|nr:hypothetical protein [Bacteroidia bacterium]